MRTSYAIEDTEISKEKDAGKACGAEHTVHGLGRSRHLLWIRAPHGLEAVLRCIAAPVCKYYLDFYVCKV